MRTVTFYSLILWLILSGCSEKEISISFPEELGVISRSDWQWQPQDHNNPTHTISKITIHHGGEDFPDDKDPLQHLRNLQSWSRSEKKWIDIPYHFMIGPAGQIYETRPIIYPGDTNTSYDPTGHALICVMGNFENQILKPVQLQSLIALSAFLAVEYKVAVSDIKGHKDYTDTLCPGKDLYRYLEDNSIRDAVQARISN